MSEARKYMGGCHCGKVRYEVTVDLGRVISCNCSHCSKRGLLLAFAPIDQFKLLTPDDVLQEYRFNRRQIQHLYCSTCGVESFARGTAPNTNKPLAAINVRCLDGVDLSALTLTPVDGKSF